MNWWFSARLNTIFKEDFILSLCNSHTNILKLYLMSYILHMKQSMYLGQVIF